MSLARLINLQITITTDRQPNTDELWPPVRSARNAEFFRSDRPWAAISISSRDDHPALCEQNRAGLLRLVFDDTTNRDNPRAFTASQAEEILEFVERTWDKVETFLIHCEIGMSRSPAIAAALSRLHYNDDGPWFEMDFPNSR